ncbi:MAG: TonB family protein [Cellvibrionaceae bacterium]
MQRTNDINEPAVDSGERLSFTVFVAAALHGLLILGLGFSYMDEPNSPPTFEVTLATHKNQQAPEKADYQAQFNQEASGTEHTARELSTRDPAPFADTRVNQVSPLPETMAREMSQLNELNRVYTSADSTFQLARLPDPEEIDTKEEQEGGDREIPLVSTEIANLRAKLDRQQQEYAKRPRIRRLTSVATIAAAEAEYLNSWRQKVEAVGNQNFPPQALQEGIFGQLRVATVLKADGTIVSVEILKSSGHGILDTAAMQIVHMAAPYSAFSPAISKDWDQLEIIRTWRFEITGLSTSNE